MTATLLTSVAVSRLRTSGATGKVADGASGGASCGRVVLLSLLKFDIGWYAARL
jgi:hypothetical protein